MQKSTTELERELNRALQDQKVLEAFEQFYADDVVMTPVSRAGARKPIANARLNGPGRSRSFTARG
jgi:hypothetical protein